MALSSGADGWLPEGKSCAICFSIDDVHPARAADGFDAGGDLEDGMLGHLLGLIEAFPQLRTSLCVTPDWRPRTPYATKPLLKALPGLSDRMFLSARWPAGKMRLDRHPGFVAFLKSIPGAEIVPHGLHHIQKGENGPAEFERAGVADCAAALRKADSIFRSAGLDPAPGHSPPGWAAPPALRRAMRDAGLVFVASARDVRTAVSPGAKTAMSGLQGQPLIYLGMTEEGLVHIPVNFQATSSVERALDILEAGGLLSIKAHAAKRVGTYVALDGLDADYVSYLKAVIGRCLDRFGERIWWASMGDVAQRFRAASPRPSECAR